MERDARYDWDRHNKAHIAGHKIEPREVEETLANSPSYIETQIDANSGEKRILELGHTNAGRILFVVWTPRGRLTRPVTAFDANRKTRTEYLRRMIGKEMP